MQVDDRHIASSSMSQMDFVCVYVSICQPFLPVPMHTCVRVCVQVIFDERERDLK